MKPESGAKLAAATTQLNGIWYRLNYNLWTRREGILAEPHLAKSRLTNYLIMWLLYITIDLMSLFYVVFLFAPSIVLYYIVLMGWSLLPNALRHFQIYCAAPNLGITRTWICRLNLAQRPIFSCLRFFNEPEISDPCSGFLRPEKIHQAQPDLNPQTLDLEVSTLRWDHRGRHARI